MNITLAKATTRDRTYWWRVFSGLAMMIFAAWLRHTGQTTSPVFGAPPWAWFWGGGALILLAPYRLLFSRSHV